MNMEAKEIVTVTSLSCGFGWQISNSSGYCVELDTNVIEATTRFILLSSFDKKLREFFSTWKYTTDLEISISVKQKGQENV